MHFQPSGPEAGSGQQLTGSVPVAVNSHAAPTVSQPHSAGVSDTETLNELMANLSANMTRQGVSTESKGLCAACSKPIIGQVTASRLFQPTSRFLHFSTAVVITP